MTKIIYISSFALSFTKLQFLFGRGGIYFANRQRAKNLQKSIVSIDITKCMRYSCNIKYYKEVI